jgi:hypothetical protein
VYDGGHVKIVCDLQLKIFEHSFVAFGLKKGFVKLQLMHS